LDNLFSLNKERVTQIIGNTSLAINYQRPSFPEASPLTALSAAQIYYSLPSSKLQWLNFPDEASDL
jgi:hypothetical protein